MNINKIPYIPNIAPPIINPKRYSLNALVNSGSTKVSDDMEVMAIMMIIIGETIPADTAASPSISAPTIESAEFAKLGSFKSLSLKISKAIVISNASMNVEKGTFSLWAAMLIKSDVGSIS